MTADSGSRAPGSAPDAVPDATPCVPGTSPKGAASGTQGSRSCRAPAFPWEGAAPERPVLFRPMPSPANEPSAPTERATPMTPSGLREAHLGDPFAWKLLPASEGLTRRLTACEKSSALALEIAGTGTGAARAAYGCYVSTPEEIAVAREGGVSFLYVPGEVCRQADVLAEARSCGLPVVLERGPFLPPSDVVRALEKLDGVACLLVDAGTVNGYADRILDPRALWLLRETGRPFGIHLGELLSPANSLYEHKPVWLTDDAFLEPLALAARALGAIAYVLPAADAPARAALRAVRGGD